MGGCNLGRKEKLVEKLKLMPRDFTFEECATLLGYLGYDRINKGKTSGSRVAFVNNSTHSKLIMHKPHPRKELLAYQVKQLKEQLEEEGLI